MGSGNSYRCLIAFSAKATIGSHRVELKHGKRSRIDKLHARAARLDHNTSRRHDGYVHRRFWIFSAGD